MGWLDPASYCRQRMPSCVIATDLACGWMLFGSRGRAAFFEAYEASDVEQRRAVGWAVNFGSAMRDSGEPRHAYIGRSIVDQLVDSG